MATNRTPIARVRKARLASPEVLAAYRYARELHDASPIDQWGCRSSEYNAASAVLHELLGRTACDRDIMDTIGMEKMPTEVPHDGWWVQEDWDEAVEIRQELERRCLVT